MSATTTGTKQKILEAAERLFAMRGIDETSVRQILLEAGQRNASAAAYHFGTRDALLRAVLDMRREAINRRRLELMSAISRERRQGDARALAGALVHPLAELIGRRGAEHYIRVTAQAIGHPRYHRLVRGAEHGSALHDLVALLRARRRDLPAAVIEQRFGMALRQVFHELADFQRLHGAGARTAPTRFFVSNLVDSIAALFEAEASADTLGELGQDTHDIARGA